MKAPNSEGPAEEPPFALPVRQNFAMCPFLLHLVQVANLKQLLILASKLGSNVKINVAPKNQFSLEKDSVMSSGGSRHVLWEV